MLVVNKIGCAMDFSEPARCAMELAADLARRYGAQLTLVHVCEPFFVATADVVLAAPGLVDAVAVREAEQMLARCRAEAQHVAGQPVFGTVLTGSVASEIVRWAGDDHADLLVVGTHGRRGLSRLVLGSVAEVVARTAPCPVVIARRPAATDED